MTLNAQADDVPNIDYVMQNSSFLKFSHFNWARKKENNFRSAHLNRPDSAMIELSHYQIKKGPANGNTYFRWVDRLIY